MATRRYFKQVRLTQLRSVIEVSRQKNFAAAAEVLDLSTPSVWQQIRALEDEFKVPLVRVDGQRVSLTEQGQLLIDLAVPVVEGFDNLLAQFSDQSQSMKRRLSVASPANILVNELPAPIRVYRDRYPNVELSLVDQPSNPAAQLLEQGEVDLAVVGYLETSCPSSLAMEKVTQFPFMLVCPTDHPILQAKRIGPKNLAKYPLVMASSGTNSRKRVNEIFEKAGLLDKLRITCEASSKDLLLQYVQLGFGITIAPISPRYSERSDSPYRDVQQLAFRDLSRAFGHEDIVILRRRHRHEPEHQKAFRQIVIDSIQ